jgi:hypothetical protein
MEKNFLKIPVNSNWDFFIKKIQIPNKYKKLKFNEDGL